MSAREAADLRLHTQFQLEESQALTQPKTDAKLTQFVLRRVAYRPTDAAPSNVHCWPENGKGAQASSLFKSSSQFLCPRGQPG